MRRPTEKHGVARRANAILLLDDGWNCEDVARALYLDDDTVRGWHKAFTTDGTQALRSFGWKGSQSKLSRCQEAELVEALSARLFPSTAAVMAHIEERYGITYSKAGTIQLLHRLGFDYRKPKGLPAKADAAAQEAFVATYEKLLNALEPTRSSISATPCIPNIRAGRPTAGSGAATSWPSSAARAASA